MTNAFLDYFRCRESVAAFGPAPDLSVGQGYFRFGDAICYGRCSGGHPARHVGVELADVSQQGACNGEGLRLPFDICEVARNLREERYTRDFHHVAERITGAGAVQSAYYLVRPFLPVGIRKHLQKLRLTGWDEIPFPRWPVDTSVDSLMRQTMVLLLRNSGRREIPFIWFWPKGASACAVMTHDIETRVGLDLCSVLMDVDDSFRIKSSFQVVPEQRYDIPESFPDSIRSRGFELSIHDLNHDGRLFEAFDQFQRRAALINEYGRKYRCQGFRAAVMYRRQDWFDALEFSYDMSVPNVAHLEPQRGGCCTVMPYFIGNILELPLTTTQDYSLFHILSDYSLTLWRRQIALVMGMNGLISFITHPDYLVEGRARRVYRYLLEHLTALRENEGLWIARPDEVDRWWRNRQKMTLVQSGDSWSIEGPEADRARVVYASLNRDAVQYSFAPASKALVTKK